MLCLAHVDQLRFSQNTILDYLAKGATGATRDPVILQCNLFTVNLPIKDHGHVRDRHLGIPVALAVSVFNSFGRAVTVVSLAPRTE